MPITISASDTNLFLDNVGSAYLRAVGTQASDYGLGTVGSNWGYVGGIADVKEALQVMAASYLEPVAALSPSVIQAWAAADGEQMASDMVRNMLTALQSHVSASQIAGVTDLDSFVTYYNVGAGGPWLALQSGLLRTLFAKWSGRINSLSPWNLFFEVLQGATYANALGAGHITGAGACTYTAGFSIDSSAYAGGFPFLNISVPVTGAGVVTVTGTSYDPVSKVATPLQTWTVNINGATASPVALTPGGGTPAPANSLILATSAISVAAGLTAGQLYVEAHRPAGRSVLPI